MKVKTENLIGPALDWAVAKIEGVNVRYSEELQDVVCWDEVRKRNTGTCSASTTWHIAGRILWDEGMTISKAANGEWITGACYGPTPLVAICRSYVMSNLGVKVEVPDEFPNKEYEV